MKISVLGILLAVSFQSFAQAEQPMTDEMALELGMTPVEKLSQAKNVQLKDFSRRSEFVSSIPSLEDIEDVIASHKQVIVVNKGVRSASNPLGQTLRLFQDGQLVPQSYTTTISHETFTKEALDISTGKEVQVRATSGRTYVSTTPKGFFRPVKMYSMYFSNTWKADMPNAMFFCANMGDCGIAIHATTVSHYGELGTRASGGCVRTRLDVSENLRLAVMDTGKGRDNFTTKTESYRRDLIVNNKVSVDNIERFSGAMVNKKVNSWDTIIVVYE